VVLVFASLSVLASGLHWCCYEFYSGAYWFDKTLFEVPLKRQLTDSDWE